MPEQCEQSGQDHHDRGYVKFALTEPGLFRTVFTQNTEPAPFYERGADNPLFKMAQALDVLVDTGYLPATRRPMAELAAWSACTATRCC